MVNRRVFCLSATASAPFVLTGCLQGMVAKTQSIIGAKPARIVLDGKLPEPEKRQWPDDAADLLTHRATGYGLIKMHELQRYLDGLYVRIKAAANLSDWPGRVFVLASTALDAHVSAAGNIYISHAWLTSMESEDEVVALMCHEFAHVYLHYHQLESTMETAKKSTMYAMVGVALARKLDLSSNASWSPAHNMALGQMMSSAILGRAWGRSQESVADEFGLKLSLMMGYSFEAGFKAFLERVVSWDEDNAKRSADLAARSRAELESKRQEQVNLARAKQSVEALRPLGEWGLKLDFYLADLTTKAVGSVGSGATELLTSHPESAARLEAVTNLVADLPDAILSKAPLTQPWQRALRQKETAAILDNYAASGKALRDLSSPAALSLAQKGASGMTAQHALPIVALFRVTLAATGANKDRNGDAGRILERNMQSAEHSSWYCFYERANQQLAAGQNAAAEETMRKAFVLFGSSGASWPPSIDMLVRMGRVDTAKQYSKICSDRFPSYANMCAEAATTQAERDKAQKEAEQKLDGVFKKIFKK